MQFTLPIKVPIILHGRGALENLKSFSEHKIMIVTDKVAKQLFGDKLSLYLSGREIIFFDDIKPNPPESTLNQAGELARSFQPQMILGIGGGSALDSAKGAYFLYGQPTKKLGQIEYFANYNLNDKCRLVLVPTTSGTGSEFSAGCVFTQEDTGMKIDVISADLIPSTVIIDPELALSMPRSMTIASGVDAFAQAIESSSSIFISDFLLALNLYAIKTIYKFLPQTAGDGANDIRAREKVHYAASLVGIAMGNVSLVIGHACAHAIGAVFNIPHGIAAGVMLPYNIEYNRTHRKIIYNEILESSFNIVGASDPAATLSSIAKEFLARLSVPTRVCDLGISKEDWNKNFDRLVKYASLDICLKTTPRPASEEEIRKILQCAYEGKNIDF